MHISAILLLTSLRPSVACDMLGMLLIDHTFFWESMCKNGGGKPTGAIGEAINKSFGSYDDFASQFKAAGATQFGSGWAWLVTDKAGKLSVTKSPNAETPIVTNEV
jgi:superoxide dismutase, Fe-Mn family